MGDDVAIDKISFISKGKGSLLNPDCINCNDCIVKEVEYECECDGDGNKDGSCNNAITLERSSFLRLLPLLFSNSLETGFR